MTSKSLLFMSFIVGAVGASTQSVPLILAAMAIAVLAGFDKVKR